MKKIFFEKELEDNKNIRIIHEGKILIDIENFSQINMKNSCYFHAFISEKVEKQEEHSSTILVTNRNQNDFLNSGNKYIFKNMTKLLEDKFSFLLIINKKKIYIYIYRSYKGFS